MKALLEFILVICIAVVGLAFLSRTEGTDNTLLGIIAAVFAAAILALQVAGWWVHRKKLASPFRVTNPRN